MEKIRIDLVRLKTEEDALKRFGRLKGMPADYNSELEELRGILQAWDKPLKIEIVIGGNIGPFTKLMEMLENKAAEPGFYDNMESHRRFCRRLLR